MLKVLFQIKLLLIECVFAVSRIEAAITLLSSEIHCQSMHQHIINLEFFWEIAF